MDAPSSQAAVAGYKAVLIAANTLDRFLPMLTTAAGTIRPAQVLIVGVGVAGLQAIATASAWARWSKPTTCAAPRASRSSRWAQNSSRPACPPRARAVTRATHGRREGQAAGSARGAHCARGCVITTAAIPGRRAPRIISRAAVERMKAGAVIVDIPAESGGNCELTRAGETVLHQGVKIVGPVNLAAQLAYHASEMYARNLLNFLKPAIDKTGALAIDWQDEVFAQSCLTHEGAIKHEATRKAVEGT
jgi:NAD(P) transhydrogenase subunit alpha